MQEVSPATTPADGGFVRDIKNKVDCVSSDPIGEIAQELDYQLPDGITIRICDSRFRASEALFSLIQAGEDAKGIHQVIHHSLAMCDTEIRQGRLSHIVLVRLTKTDVFKKIVLTIRTLGWRKYDFPGLEDPLLAELQNPALKMPKPMSLPHRTADSAAGLVARS
jgi:hypothetical protein